MAGGNVLITGGAGFVGSNLAVGLSRLGYRVTCFDNLSRAGSHLNLERLKTHGCEFIHGDIRNPEDFQKIGSSIQYMIEASAEPSVLAGAAGNDCRNLLNNNLIGSINCYEYSRRYSIPTIFISTSRVYPIASINGLNFVETATRYEYHGEPTLGISDYGISEAHPLNGVRSLYGASKLASELILQEYSSQYDLPAIINRCGVLAGPWQFGKADQGVFTYWMLRHVLQKPLRYIGYGGSGKQVRDLLHIEDYVELVSKQLDKLQDYRGQIFNVGGSRFANLSLVETTEHCQQISGKHVPISKVPQERPYDIRWFVSDNRRVSQEFDWHPKRQPHAILADIHTWVIENQKGLVSVLGD